MNLSHKYTLYTIISIVVLNMTAGAFIFMGINPLLDQIDMHMSANFNPTTRFNPVIADDRPLIMLGFAAIVGVSVLFTIVQLLMFRSQVIKPLRRTVEQAALLARGDFSSIIENDYKAAGEIADLRRSIRFTRDRMLNYVNRLQASRVREHEANNRADTPEQLNADFLSNIALELKNPMTSILGFAHLALREIDSRVLGDDLRYKCQNIIDSAENLNNFIDKLLRLSHLDPGHYFIRRAEIHTADFLQELGEACRIQSEYRKISIACHYSPDQPDLILCDRDMLSGGLGLLLDGIIKTSPLGAEVGFGCIRSGTKVIFWLKAPPCEKMYLSLAAMYRKNFLNPSSSQAEQLSGALMLNLTIAKSSLELIHAGVSVLGPDEDGSEFIISFNADDIIPEHTGEESSNFHMASNLNSSSSTRRQRTRDRSDHAVRNVKSRPLHVILLESDGNTHKLLKEIFRQAGHTIDCVPDEKTCCDLAVESGCDLLIIDIEPQLRPAVFLKTLRERLDEKMPHIVVTAVYLDDTDRRTLQNAGVDECWAKPMDVNMVFERISALSCREKNTSSTP